MAPPSTTPPDPGPPRPELTAAPGAAPPPVDELDREAEVPTPYLTFERDRWAKLREDTPLTLSLAELELLRGLNSPMSLEDVVEVYLPLSRLIELQAKASRQLNDATATFLGEARARAPFLIGMAGSVAVGKSTAARVLRELLSRWSSRPTVELVTTDGFLYPNAELARRGLMRRKGFPESYDRGGLLRFVADLKAGAERVTCPVYSHHRYDIVEGEERTLVRPDIVIVEGLNVLQTGRRVCVSDFFDLTIFLDAPMDSLRRWYVSRFLKLRDTAFRDPGAYFHRYASLTDAEARALALSIWEEINEINLRENILHTCERATLVLEKGASHRVERVRLRRR